MIHFEKFKTEYQRICEECIFTEEECIIFKMRCQGVCNEDILAYLDQYKDGEYTTSLRTLNRKIKSIDNSIRDWIIKRDGW